jgi:threonine dehydratase
VEQSFLAEHGPALEAAARRIADRVTRTPLLAPADLPGLLLKPECLQATGSFKVRGAFNAVLCLIEAAPDTPGVATVSSGNHGQALAYVARALGLPAVVVMPADAAAVKRDAVRRYGARVVDAGVTTDNREERFVEVLAETGYSPVHPFDDWNVIHGQASAGLEIAADAPDAPVVAVPVGGGGLISGIALALAQRAHPARIVGVEPAAADDARRSLEAGRVTTRSGATSIADGALAARIGERPARLLLEQRAIDEIVTVTDDELRASLPRIWAQTRLIVEPTGALALTAALLGRFDTGGRAVVVVSGGNVDPAFVARTIQEAPEESRVAR